MDQIGMVAALEVDVGLTLAKFLSSPAVASTIVAKGMEPYAKVQ